jgi:hypothetical protein
LGGGGGEQFFQAPNPPKQKYKKKTQILVDEISKGLCDLPFSQNQLVTGRPTLEF